MLFCLFTLSMKHDPAYINQAGNRMEQRITFIIIRQSNTMLYRVLFPDLKKEAMKKKRHAVSC